MYRVKTLFPALALFTSFITAPSSQKATANSTHSISEKDQSNGMTMKPLVLLLLSSILASAISFQLSCMPSKDMNVRNDRLSLHHVSASRSKWDELIDEDEDDAMQFNGGPPVPRDMKYNLINIKRQRENYDSIRTVSGIELINDVYCRDAETSVFWFVGKVARVSDVTIEKAIARQWGE
jgi:hypothetical protein